MKLIRILSVTLLVTFLSALCLVNVKPAFAAAAENTWEIKTPMPEGVYSGRAAVVDGKIYVMKDTINYQYDPATDIWTAKTPMPTPRSLFGIAVWQDKIYAISGASRFDWDLGRYILSDANEVYDPSTDTWETKQPMPTARAQLQASAFNGQIYLVGGRNATSRNVAFNEVYNVANDSWTAQEPIPYPVAGYASAVCSGKIYVIGGQDEFSASVDVNFVQIYDAANDSWSLGAPMPTTVNGAAAGVTTGAMASRRIYLIGGFSPTGGSVLGLVQVYDPQSNTWAFGASMPSVRHSLAVAVASDKIYAIGGDPYIAPGATYDPITNRDWYTHNEVYTPFGYGSPDPIYVLEHYPPKISFVSPLNQTYNETDVPLLFNVDKPVNLACYSLDGKQNVTIIGNTTLTGLSNGLHSVTVYANDTYGNTAASETVAFNISPPFPIVPVATVSVAVTVATAAGLLVYFKKHHKNRITDAYKQPSQKTSRVRPV
jgi:N-acetylneuraminic acid mutarotase